MKQPKSQKKNVMPKKEAEAVQFTLKLQKARVVEMTLKEPSEELIAVFNAQLLKIQISLRFVTTLETESVRVYAYIVYNYYETAESPASPPNILLNFESSFDFVLTNMNAIAEKTKNGLVLQTPVLAMLGGIAVSTSRGMIIEKTSGSYLNQFFVPIINPEDLVKGLVQDKVE